MGNKKGSKSRNFASATTTTVLRRGAPANAVPKPGHPKKGRKGGSSKSTTNGVPPYVLARLDPFNVAANGIKTPDENQTYSIPFQVKTETGVAADATYGCGATALFPDPSSISLSPATIASTTSWTWPATYTGAGTATNISTIRAQVQDARVVAWGVRVNTQASFTNAQGLVHVCLVPMDFSAANWSASMPTSIAGMKVMPGYNYTTVGDLIENECILPGRLLDSSAHRYRQVTTPWLSTTAGAYPNGGENQYGWYAVLVALEGGIVNTIPLAVESIIHYEGVARPGTTLSSNTQAAPYQPTVMAIATNICDSAPAARITNDAAGDGGFWDKVRSAMDTAIRVVNGIGDAAGIFYDLGAFFL